LDQLSSPQLSEWEAYDRLEPIGEWRADFRTATLISAVVNLAKSIWGKEGGKMTSPTDFMPKWDEEPKAEPVKQSVEEMKQIIYAIADISKKKERKLHNRPPRKRQKKK